MDLRRITELGFEKSSRLSTLVISVSFSLWWNLIIVMQCYIITLVCSFYYFHEVFDIYAIYLLYIFDAFYVCEVVLTIKYRRDSKLKKLNYTKTRGWFFIILDIISLIPLELMYTYHYVSEDKESYRYNAFTLNRMLRIYRIFQLESFYGIKVRKSTQYIILMTFQFTLTSLLIAHIFSCLWLRTDKSVKCNPENSNCIIFYESNMVTLIILNWGGQIETFQKPWERVLVLGAVFCGFALLFTHFYPYVLYVSMQLHNTEARYYEKYSRLQRYLKHMVPKPEMRNALLRYFKDVWKQDKSEGVQKKLFANLPLPLKKEIFTDIYWETFNHSELFRNTSRSCKRSLALTMTTEHFHSGEIIYRKGEKKLQMIFLIQGIIQIMAEENEESPVLSFSSGTVFGEFSLFYHNYSQALAKCKSYCEIQILTMRATSYVLKDYPKDKKIVFENLYRRLLIAKHTQWRKLKFREQKLQVLDLGATSNVEDCVKWIKTQWRAVWEEHQRHRLIMKAKEEGFRLPSWQRQLRPTTNIEFVSNYLDLIVLSDVFEEKKDVVCIRMAFPWSIDPSAHFLRMWYHFVLVVITFPICVYPFCTAWLDNFPWEVYVMSHVITIVNILDVLIKLLTAIQTKHFLVTNFAALFRRKLHQPSFYLDVAAAIPIQIYIFELNLLKVSSHRVGLLLHPALLKAHMLFSVKVSFGKYMGVATLFKNCYIFVILVYWLSEIIQLRLKINEQNEITNGWYNRLPDNLVPNNKPQLASVMRAVVNALGIPDFYMYPDSTETIFAVCLIKFTFFLYFCLFFANMFGEHMIRVYAPKIFEVLSKRIHKILQSIYISSKIKDNLLKTINFQWRYDQADYLCSKVSINKSIPDTLKVPIYSETTYKTVKSCRMFESESTEFIYEVLDKSFLVAVPAGSSLVTYGHTIYTISILHRGHVQFNSFITTDIVDDISPGGLWGPGTIFPALSSFCNVPAVVSVITHTDCEVIMINLDDLLTLMLKHEMLKDIIDILKEGDYLKKVSENMNATVKVILESTKIKAVSKADNERIRIRCRRDFCCGAFILALCPKKCISLHFAKKWEIFYNSYILLVYLMWSSSFGIFLYGFHLIVPFISLLNLISFTHIILSFFTPYYNERGILVTHPAFTFYNSITSNFALDFIYFVPIYTFYYFIIKHPFEQPALGFVILEYIKQFAKVVYVLGYLDTMSLFEGSQYGKRMTKLTIFFFLAFHFLVNIYMYLSSTWIFDGPNVVIGFIVNEDFRPVSNPFLIRQDNLLDFYIYVSYWVVCTLFTTDYQLSAPTGVMIYCSYVQAFIGTLFNFVVYTWISSNSTFANLASTVYQEEMTSFVQFLKLQKADDRLIERALTYCNYELSETQGENLKKIFDHLPIYLHEELVYPLYRSIFLQNKVLAQANEGFFKILSRHMKSVFFNRGSIVIFENESQAYIYFLRKGKCFVYDWFLSLEVGSIIGDIKQTGLMSNTIYALSHVEMLRISSNNFYNILNNFDDLEANFIHEVRNLENFIKPIEQDIEHNFRLHPVDSLDVLNAFGLQIRSTGLEVESFFEDRVSTAVQKFKTSKKGTENKMRFLVIYPGTKKMKVFVLSQFIVGIVTQLIVPTIMSFGGMTNISFFIVGVLDFFWLLIILVTFRVGYIDEAKGDVITDVRFLSRRYAKKWNGLGMDLLAVVPLELIPIILAGSVVAANPTYVGMCRLPRILRGLFKSSYRKEVKLKSLYVYILLLTLLVWFCMFVNIFIALTSQEIILEAKNPRQFNSDQFFAFVFASEFLINLLASSNLFICIPNTIAEIFFYDVVALMCPYVKGWLISEILFILFVSGLATSFYKAHVISLEAHLKNRDTSPSIIKEVLNYELNLLWFSRSENMPSFLKRAPSSLRIMIMKDFYLHHMYNCPLFRNLEPVFLDQLVARMKREIYLPGQKIVEQHDVDHQMYFIHSGEVYVLKQTKEKAYVEYVTAVKFAGEYFGEAQGLWYGLPHVHSYRARTLSEILALHSVDWVDLRRNFPNIAMQIFERARNLRIIYA